MVRMVLLPWLHLGLKNKNTVRMEAVLPPPYPAAPIVGGVLLYLYFVPGENPPPYPEGVDF